MATRIVVVGAGLAGASAAAELRRRGFDGELVLVGAEQHDPYTRPPLSKAWQTGGPRDLTLQQVRRLEVTHLRGVAATGLDLSRQVVDLSSGTPLGYDGIVVASGSEPVRLPNDVVPEGLYLRTIEDANRLRTALTRPTALPLLVVGAGLIGSEIASVARSIGRQVILVDIAEPCVRAVGATASRFIADLHRRNGVDLLTGTGLQQVEPVPGGSLAVLSDGSAVTVSDVVVSVGARPTTGWLANSGLTIANGVVCDSACIASDGAAAAGDVACWTSNADTRRTVRLETWNNAAEMGRHAAGSLLSLLSGEEPDQYVPLPSFWTEQHGVRIQVAGFVEPEAGLTITSGSIEEGEFVGVNDAQSFIVAVNRPKEYGGWLSQRRREFVHAT